MSLTEPLESNARARMKLRDLAKSCGWLGSVLAQQDRIVSLIAALETSSGLQSWGTHWWALEHAVLQHFRVQELVLAPAIGVLGLGAQAVVAERGRVQVRRHLDDLRWASWSGTDRRIEQLRATLESHFAHEESWSYLALVRSNDASANAGLTRRCAAALDKHTVER